MHIAVISSNCHVHIIDIFYQPPIPLKIILTDNNLKANIIVSRFKQWHAVPLHTMREWVEGGGGRVLFIYFYLFIFVVAVLKYSLTMLCSGSSMIVTVTSGL